MPNGVLEERLRLMERISTQMVQRKQKLLQDAPSTSLFSLLHVIHFFPRYYMQYDTLERSEEFPLVLHGNDLVQSAKCDDCEALLTPWKLFQLRRKDEEQSFDQTFVPSLSLCRCTGTMPLRCCILFELFTSCANSRAGVLPTRDLDATLLQLKSMLKQVITLNLIFQVLTKAQKRCPAF